MEPNPEDVEIMCVFTKLYCEDIRPKVLKYIEQLESGKQPTVDIQRIDQGASSQQNNLVDVTATQGITGTEPNDDGSGGK